MIQSVLDHSLLLIGDGFHAELLGNVLAHQTIEVLFADALPAAIRIGKVGHAEAVSAMALGSGDDQAFWP
jgi:hypothetical protein